MKQTLDIKEEHNEIVDFDEFKQTLESKISTLYND